ncbi:MAG TPA: DUF3971 domain-containing protein [Beijerinckiaceae bacterium]
MKHLTSTILRRLRRGRRGRTRLGRILRGTLYVKLGLALVLGLATGLLYLRLSAAPLSFEGLSERVAAAIASRIGPGWNVVLKDSAVALEDGALALRTAGLDVRNPDGLLVLRSPNAVVGVDTMALLTGSLQPRFIEFRDLQVRAAVNRDGTLSFVAAEGSEPQAVTWPPPGAAPGPASPDTDGPSLVSLALGSLFDLVLEPRGVVGALDRARVTNARLTLVGADGRERAAFRQVTGLFERSGADGRRFDVALEGPRGRWRINGDLKAGNRHRGGSISVSEVPIEDLLLLSGLSNAPATSDLKLSGQADAIITDGRIAKLETRLATNAGMVQIDDKDMPPIDVAAASAHGVWDEARRTFALDDIAFRSAGTEVRLKAEIGPGPAGGWRASVSGRDAVVRGPEPGEKPFAIAVIEATARGGDGALVLERLKLAGPTLDVTLDGAYGTAADPKALSVQGIARATAVRTALRLWPNSVSPKVRDYLVRNLRAGTADLVDLSVALSGPDLAKAMADGPVPDAAVKVAFAIADGELKVAEGLPPLSGLAASGLATGTRAEVRVPRGRVAMAEGRALALSEGTFDVPDVWSGEVPANVALKLDGGADALGALLQTPLLQGAAGVDLDPAGIKGRADLKIALTLPLKNVPKMADLPLRIAGRIGDLSIEKAFGKERLDGANLDVRYANGGVNIKGEGRLWGVPAAIDVRQPKAAPGEAVVSFTLDDAARARKGLAFGQQLTGPVPVKVALPLGTNAKPGAKVEVDLTRAVVDNLVPGWVKPTGRPGKLSFFVPEGSTELREFALDSGTVQMRGTVTVSADGQLDRAELASFKLSPGDDMRVQLERAAGVYKVTVRGPIADARPFIRSMTSPGSGKETRETKDSRDVDLDVATNILTGFNDEALTAASIKATIRNREMRQFQFSGRLRAAPVTAQIARAERGAPVLVLESADAGATLRFVDVYRRMHGGALAVRVTTGDGPQRGVVSVDGFTLRDEPALKRIASTQVQAGMPEDRAMNMQVPRFDVSEVQFTRLEAEFGRTASRLEFRDGVVFGPQVGFKGAGWIDYGRDRTDISGTFVPAYGINNAFTHVPLFGRILMGGQNEGLFAVNFRISGLASAPTLTVNPLSAVAPGFLRKLFGTGPAATDATGTTLMPPPRTER